MIKIIETEVSIKMGDVEQWTERCVTNNRQEKHLNGRDKQIPT
jgi:hypothetical protein